MNEHRNREILRPFPPKMRYFFVGRHFLKKIHEHLSNQYFKIARTTPAASVWKNQMRFSFSYYYYFWVLESRDIASVLNLYPSSEEYINADSCIRVFKYEIMLYGGDLFIVGD